MARYWWVNHKKTHRQEIGGGFLWSPKFEPGPKRSEFYNNMARAAPGDWVLSYAFGTLGHVGRVTDFAITAAKPEFGAAGDAWIDEGWLLPVAWDAFHDRLSPKSIIDELGPLLPNRYGPLNPITGNGRQKAYLSEISEAAFQRVVTAAGYQTDLSDLGSLDSGFDRLVSAVEKDQEAAILDDQSLSDTEKHDLRKARRGQGRFRAAVELREARCRLTGVATPALLVASHIKPWRSCTTAKERLDGDNGLLLTPHVDRLFDRGMISFEDDGAVLVSPRVDLSDIERLGLAASVRAGCGPFSNEQRQYLAYHRAQVFLVAI